MKNWLQRMEEKLTFLEVDTYVLLGKPQATDTHRHPHETGLDYLYILFGPLDWLLDP